jgi:hypothetical protein
MDALLILAVYVAPFVALGIITKRWIDRKNIGLSDVRAEGDRNRKRRSRFFLGIWRDDGRD